MFDLISSSLAMSLISAYQPSALYHLQDLQEAQFASVQATFNEKEHLVGSERNEGLIHSGAIILVYLNCSHSFLKG